MTQFRQVSRSRSCAEAESICAPRTSLSAKGSSPAAWQLFLSSARSPLILRVLLWKRRRAGDPASFYSPQCASEVAQLRSPPPRTLLLAMAQQEGLRLFPTAFLQMVTPCLPAARVPGAPRSPAGGLLPFLCLAGFSAALRRGHGSISPQDTRRQRGLLQAQPCPSASPPLLGPELPQRAVRGLLQAHGCLLLPGWFRPGSSQSAGGRQSCGGIVTVWGQAGSCHHPVGTCRREHSP